MDSETRSQATTAARAPTSPSGGQRRWVALVFMALAQLMIALDATIVNIALPSAQAALRISDADRQWAITGSSLAFGGLLPLGGRLADFAGRRRAFLIGLVGFAVASTLGGAATGAGMLIGARALQGAFAAILAPATLSLLAVTFTTPKERARAFTVYGAIAGSGGAIGLILGGALAEHLSWRWCLYVNAPVALAAVVGGSLTIAATPRAPRPRLDVPGALLATGGLAAVVYACTQAVAHGWGSTVVLGWLAGGGVALAAFALVESRIREPLLPLALLGERNRAGAYLSVALAVAGMFGMFLFLTYYFQVVLRYSPMIAGLAFLPLSAAVLAGSGGIASRLLPRVPPRTLIAPGLLLGAAGMLVLTQLGAGDDYTGRVLPAELLLGAGMGLVFVPAFNVATHRVAARQAGVASAVVNTAQQVGGSLGVALLNTVATGATAGYLAGRVRTPSTVMGGLVHGYAVAAVVGAGIMALAACLAAVLITTGRPATPEHPAAERR